MHFVCREAKQKEKEEKALKEKETLQHKANNEEEETKAAVVLQSNYRGFKERKKFKERTKTMAGAELEIPPNVGVEVGEDGAQEPAGKDEEQGRMADKQEENDEDEESTYEAEDNDDSDHTQVPEDDEHTEVADEAVVENADAGKKGEEEDKRMENVEEETKAATVLQSNFRGHKERKRLQEEGKIPAKKDRPKSPTAEEEVQTAAEEMCSEATERESTDATDAADISSIDIMLEDETKAAVVLQSNFRGHKERKRLEEEGKIPKKRKKEEETTPELPKEEEEEEVIQTDESQAGASVQNSEGLDEEKAATVLQSTFRGHRERKKLKAEREMQQDAKEEAASETETTEDAEGEGEDALDVTDVVIERKDEADAERERLEEEQAAVKIQSNFRGYRDRKHLKADKQTAQTQAAQLESFSEEVTS